MEELKFKTTLSCGGCLSKVREDLDEIVGTEKRNVDLTSADKTLTVPATDGIEERIKEAFEAKGFEAVRV